MTTTIVPGLGHSPLLTQTGTGSSPGFDAVDFRRLATAGLQEGVMAATSFEVTQRGAGANMSVDIAASTADTVSGVAALIQGDAVTGQSLYPVPAHTVVINETVGAAHASLPRVDRVILELQDTTHDASGGNLARTRVVAGTATSGATLTNLTGAAAVPSSALLLADVLVGAAASSLSNAVIRDRRKWARGAHCRIVRNSNAAAGNDYAIASSTVALVDATNLAPRIECSGVPVRVRLTAVVFAVSTGNHYFTPQVDGVGINGMMSVGDVYSVTGPLGQDMAANAFMTWSLEWEFTPAAGSHVIAPACVTSSSMTLRASAVRPLLWVVEEVLRQDSRNNATTTG